MTPDDLEPNGEAAKSEDDFVQRLSEYDERLRQGTLIPPETPAVNHLAPELEPSSLHDCLHLLERAWPRSIAVNDSNVPERIGRFQLERILGIGGFGIVYLATDPTLQRKVALKVPRLHSLANSKLRERFKREGRAAGALDHPNIVPIHETGETGPICYIASAYCPGPNLAEWLKAQAAPVPIRVAATIVKILAEAVAYSHARGVLHRDLKPSNVLLGPRENDHRSAGNDSLSFIPRVTDFGFAKMLGEELDLTATTAIFGTPAYMSPEQTGRRGCEIGPATDVYALGIILYELLTGRPPFQAASFVETLNQVVNREPLSPRLLNTDVPKDLETICLKCIEKKPGERCANAAELAEQVGLFLMGKPIRYRRIGPLAHGWRWCRRRPAWALLSALSILSLVGTGLGLFIHDRDMSALNLKLAGLNNEFADVNTQLIDKIAAAATARDAAKQEKELSADMLYASDLRVAAGALQDHDPRTLVRLLNRHIPAGETRPERRGFEWYFLERQTRRAHHKLLEQEAAQYFVCYSPDNRWIAASGRDAIVRLFDADTEEPGREFTTNQWEVNGLAFDADGKFLATAGDDGSVIVWEVVTGRMRLRIPHANPEHVFQVIFLPGQSVLACCGEDSLIRLFDAETGEPCGELAGHNRTVQEIRLGQDGNTLVSTSSDGSAKLWNIRTRLETGTLRGDSVIGSLAVDSQRNLVVTGAADRYLKSWRISDSLEISRLHLLDEPSCLALHPTERLLAIGDNAGSLHLQDLDGDGKLMESGEKTWQAHRGKVHSLAWSADGAQLLSAGNDGRVINWSLSNDMGFSRLELNGNGAGDIALLPDCSRFAVVNGKGLEIWDWQMSQIAMKLDARWWADVEIAADGATLAAWSQNGVLATWRIADWKMLSESQPDGHPSWGFALSPDGHLVAVSRHNRRTATADGARSVCLYDSATCRLLDEIDVPTCRKLAFTPDSRRLAIADDFGLMLWRLSEKKRQWYEAQTTIHALTFSPDGKWLVSCDGNREALVRNSETGSIAHRLVGHRGPIMTAAFSPDGRTLATGAQDGSIKLWHLATGQELFEISHREEACTMLRFTKDGKHLVALVGFKRLLIFHGD